MTALANGVWPTMLTPFTTELEVDYAGLEQLVEWYIGQGVQGLFAVCQSSEMFRLSLEERASIARFVLERAAGRVPVIASGHVSERPEEQIEEIKRISATGVAAFVIVTNRLARNEDTEDTFKRNVERLLASVPEVAFGLYECPYPYKRLLSPQLLRWLADTGRFHFLKDTSCDPAQIRAKLDAVRGSRLKLFNANSATLLESLRLGAAGFSGVMANFHPDLYVKLMALQTERPQEAEALQAFLGVASLIERQMYPVNAKYHLLLEGVRIGLASRVSDPASLTFAMRREVEQVRAMARIYREGGWSQ